MKGPIARGTIRTSFVLGLRLAVQSATLLVVARMLGPHEFGAFSGIASLAVLLGTLATCGTHMVLLEKASNDLASSRQVLAWALPTTFAAASILLLVYLFLAPRLLSDARISTPYLLAIGASEIIAQPLVTLFSARHLAREQVARSQLLQVIAPVLRLIAASAIWLVHLRNPLGAYAISYIFAAAFAYALGRATLLGTLPPLRNWHIPSARQLSHASGYAVLNVTRAGPSELDKTLSARLLPLYDAGIYSVAGRIIGAITIPITAMTLASLPRLFRAPSESPADTARLIRWMIVAAIGYSAAAAILVWAITPAIAWLFGPAYRNIVPTLHWLCLAAPGLAIRMVAGNVLMAVGKPWLRVGFETTGIAALAAGSIILVPAIGTFGIVFAVVGSEWAMAILGVAMVFLTKSRYASKASSQDLKSVSSTKGRT